MPTHQLTKDKKVPNNIEVGTLYFVTWISNPGRDYRLISSNHGGGCIME